MEIWGAVGDGLTMGSGKKRMTATKKTRMGEVIDNEDLLVEILIHLLPTHVIRLRSVCKQWRKLISSPCFRLRHTVYFLENNVSRILLPSVLLQSPYHASYMSSDQQLHLTFLDPDRLIAAKDDPPPDVLFSFIFYHYPHDVLVSIDSKSNRSLCYKILHSSNGLVLLYSIKTGGRGIDVFLCNPLTKDYIKIPQPPMGIMVTEDDAHSILLAPPGQSGGADDYERTRGPFLLEKNKTKEKTETMAGHYNIWELVLVAEKTAISLGSSNIDLNLIPFCKHVHWYQE